jgi:hypothetical protein
MKKYFLILPVILLLAAACSSKQAINSNQQSNTQQTTPSPTPSQTAQKPTPTPKPTVKSSDLKTYANSQYGFSFSYPYKTLQLKDCAAINLKYSNILYKQCIYVVPPSELAPSHDGVMAVFDSNMNDTVKMLGAGGASVVVEIHGVDWTLLMRPDGLADYLTEVNGKTLWLIYAQTVKQSDFDQIIASFKLLK